LITSPHEEIEIIHGAQKTTSNTHMGTSNNSTCHTGYWTCAKPPRKA
jgi:hypothetical protein